MACNTYTYVIRIPSKQCSNVRTLGDFKLGKEVTEVWDKGLNLTAGPGELTAKR